MEGHGPCAKKQQIWCRGPESNWLRPPFQGGALPLSYPGTCGLEIVWAATRLCQFDDLSDPASLRRFVELLHPAFAFEDFPRAGAVRWADDAIFFHEVNQVGGAAIANAQPPL